MLHEYIKIKIYRTIILPVGWYGCESWFLTLIEEHRQNIWEQGNEHYHLYSLPGIGIIILRMRWMGYVALMGVKRNADSILVG
jgi:hypothetical protein